MSSTIVIIHPGSLGDVLLALPAIRRIRSRYPTHEVIVCAGESVSRLLMDCQEVDGWVSSQGSAMTWFFEQEGTAAGALQEYLARCDVAVAWMQDQEALVSQALRKSGAVKTIVSSPFSSAWQSVHQSDRFSETLGEWPITAETFRPIQIPVSLAMRGRTCLERAGINPGKPFMAIHPGSGSPKKSIAIEQMADMISTVQREGLQPLVIEGPADQEAVADLLERLSAPVAILRNLDLATLAGSLSHAARYVGHDSGITHLAALLGLQTHVYFGPTDPGRWTPRGGHVVVIQVQVEALYNGGG
jgi:heptosyltransferase III